jgi:hypothetical protein
MDEGGKLKDESETGAARAVTSRGYKLAFARERK